MHRLTLGLCGLLAGLAASAAVTADRFGALYYPGETAAFATDQAGGCRVTDWLDAACASVDVPTAASERPVARKPMQVAAVAFADRLPDGGALTYRWSVVSGDASLVTFEDATQASTTFIARKKGTYALQLAVSDGERTVCSKPVTVEVESPGMAIILR